MAAKMSVNCILNHVIHPRVDRIYRCADSLTNTDREAPGEIIELTL